MDGTESAVAANGAGRLGRKDRRVPPVTSATFPRSRIPVSSLEAIVQLAGTVTPTLSTSGVVPKTDEASSRTSPPRTLSGRRVRASTATT
jgi:hypothetical protein